MNGKMSYLKGFCSLLSLGEQHLKRHLAKCEHCEKLCSMHFSNIHQSQQQSNLRGKPTFLEVLKAAEKSTVIVRASMCHSSLLFPSRKAGDDPYYLPVHISPYSNSGVHISYTILTLGVHISYNTNQKLANIFETLPTGVGNMDPKEVGNMVSSKKLCVRVGFHRGKAREKSQRRSKSTGGKGQ